MTPYTPYNGENTILGTSANQLLDNSYLSALHTGGNGTDDDM